MKKILAAVLALTLISALGLTAMAAKDAVDSITWTDGFGFHCNAANGNGKVVTGSESKVIDLVNVGATAYQLQTSAKDAIVCPKCERIDWVTYSNNNGKITGKNIQVNHSGSPVYLATASATLTLIDTIVSDCPEVTTGSKEAGTESQSGLFKTNETASFTFDIPEGYEIIEGTNPVVITFEPIAGQNLSGAVVAEKIINVACECEVPGEPDEDDSHKCILVCANCYSNSDQNNDGLSDCFNNAHKNCSNNAQRKCAYIGCTYSVNDSSIICACCGGKEFADEIAASSESIEVIEIIEDVVEETNEEIYDTDNETEAAD